MKNTRQQDFFFLAKNHYGNYVYWIENAKIILGLHSMIEVEYIGLRDLAKVMLNDLFPLLNQREQVRFVEELIDCECPEAFIESLLSAITMVQVYRDDAWVMPFERCEPDPAVLSRCRQMKTKHGTRFL